MKTNFEIEKNYALELNKRHIDLHNNFDFVNYNYDVLKGILTLNWKKTTGDWVKADELNTLSLVRKQVSYLKIEKDGSYNEDDDCLMNLGYYPSSERNMNDLLSIKDGPDSNDDVIYIFQSDWFIRVKAEEIELITHN